jgi:hypothetical protein
VNYTSKLSAGDTGWLIRENRVVSLPIGSVTITVVASEQGLPLNTSVEYGFRIYGRDKKFKDWEQHAESEVFGSKKKLLASL